MKSEKKKKIIERYACEICGTIQEVTKVKEEIIGKQYFFSQQPTKPVLEGTVRARVCQYINRKVHGDKTCLCDSPVEKLPNKNFDGMEYGCEYNFDSIKNPDAPPTPYTIPSSY
jgi:hypothetical protein